MVRKTTSVPERSSIIDATLALAAERGWHAVSLADIAVRAGIGLADLHEQFDGKTAILKAFLDCLDDALWKGPLAAGDEPARDRLFDVIMRRFDSMQPYKEGIRAIVKGSASDPWMLFCSAPHLLRTASLMLEVAGISASGPVGRVKAKGVAVIYLAAFRTWLTDESSDMARTMATLDRALRRAESIASFIGRGPGAPFRGGETGAQ
ncbi:TetR/AcrR family transcriptional regulator [Telmatospirillum siberiense]|uniref:HTH tetR-type domain-containing protein n=1 Tax=Telmatospirillum siberiense TaxID=382514 RepID=A0A2N3PU79_9PROT|nr:TetR/AcrR family transcriptional regulator [Telmatospirillum siberiense]PKU23940.1 hypothetical protein CWS72_13780 [Telmatospirillum siberiense]